METTAVALRAYVGAFVDELARAGVTDACICPGSRSTPLAMLLREHPAIRTWMHLDERSAAFFALGMAKASHKPVAMLCTSGTAAANFMPAVVEAHYGQTPLLVLTADRPAELRDVGALQTIDQVRLYGSHVKRFEEMLLPEATPLAVRHARTVADRAVATALSSPAGPVHLNFPFREPLIPAPAEEASAGAPVVEAPAELPRMLAGSVAGDLIERLLPTIRGMSRGLIVCGPQDEEGFATYAVQAAEALGCPLLADAFSQTRRPATAGALVIDRFDAFLRRAEVVESLVPEFVIRTGATPVSKPLQQYLERHRAAHQVVIAPPGTWPDPGGSGTEFIWGEPWLELASIEALSTLCRDTADPAARESWNDTWRRSNEIADFEIEGALSGQSCMSEPLVFRRLAELVPEDTMVFAGNSMPVRDLDSFWPASTKRVRFMANRGASGIDGVVSTALGVAAASDKPVVLVIGDISLYHDMNGLLAAKRHGLSATIVVISNDGGGIFSFLPQAERGDGFEELFGTPHGLDFKYTAALYGLDYSCPDTPDDFDAAVMRSLGSPGVALIEVKTDRDENLALHRDIWAKVAAALARERGPSPQTPSPGEGEGASAGVEVAP